MIDPAEPVRLSPVDSNKEPVEETEDEPVPTITEPEAESTADVAEVDKRTID